MQLGRHFHTTGLLVGTIFFAISLTPTLLPRADVVQGIISGLSLSAGYGIGVIAFWLWSYLKLPMPRSTVQLSIQLVATGLCALFAVAFLWRASGWQNSLRALMGMDELTGVQLLVVGLIALTIFVAILVIAGLFHRTFLFLSRRLQRYVPHRVSHLIGLTAAFILFWSIIDGIFFTLALRAADSSYQQIDALIEPDIDAPVDPLKTGSAQSLLAWENLGRQGRRFLSTGPTAAQISAFTDEEVLEPIRVYVGLNSAETPEMRARLALEELQRVGAFERSVLLLITPTGTGWVDPGSIDPAEYLHRGDIASVAVQYSYLPSPLSLMAEGAYGAENARALFQEVYGYWSELPETERPALYLHGLSLGALNSDRSFDFYDIIDDPFHGALWSGPPFRSETWQTVTERRQPGSPAWLPQFRDGSVVRFANQQGGLEYPQGTWGSFRIAYLQYASDPVTFFEPQSFYREPEWMKEPRGPDVTADLRWFPIVTMLQLAADLAAGFSPRGYGHDYAAEHYHDAWLALTEPQGWTDEQLERLRSLHAGDEIHTPDLLATGETGAELHGEPNERRASVEMSEASVEMSEIAADSDSDA